MRKQGSSQELERKRLRAIELSQAGRPKADIAAILGVSLRSVQDSIRIATAKGVEALRTKPHWGPTPKLTPKQFDKLRSLVLKGATANGFATELWTGPRVAQLIQDKFQVTYHSRYLPELLRRLGFSCQKPERQARQRDEQAVAGWIDRNWERIKKTRGAGARPLRFSRNRG